MRGTVKWVLSGTMIATTLVLSACQRLFGDPRTTSKETATLTVTANCVAGNQVDVVVDQWVLYMKKKGVVTLAPQTTSGASIELTQKSPEQWPFDDAPPLRGNARAKIKDKDGDYRYNVRVACAIGASGDSVRVVIDPDIIVN